MTKTVVIVGGGSAGWLTAGIIAARHNPLDTAGQGTKVILLESPDVANLGVGEGTWPTMRDTLRQIGISEVDFLRPAMSVLSRVPNLLIGKRARASLTIILLFLPQVTAL